LDRIFCESTKNALCTPLAFICPFRWQFSLLNLITLLQQTVVSTSKSQNPSVSESAWHMFSNFPCFSTAAARRVLATDFEKPRRQTQIIALSLRTGLESSSEHVASGFIHKTNAT